MNKALLCAITLLTALFGTARADNFSIGVENIEYLPFSNVQNKQYSGFYREILDKFAKEKGHSFTYHPLPIKRLTDEFLGGSIDFKIPDNKVWAQQLKAGKNIAYSTPLTTYVDGIMVKPDNKGQAYAKLTSIVTVRGFTPFPFLDDIAKGKLKLSEANSFPSVLKMVAGGRVRGGFINVTVAQYYMDKVMKQPGMLVYDDSLPKGISEISLSSLKHPQLIAEFNQWLASNKPWLSQLKGKYNISE